MLTGAQRAREFSQDVGTFTTARENTRNIEDCRREKPSAYSFNQQVFLTELNRNSKPGQTFPELPKLEQEVFFSLAMFLNDRGRCASHKALVPKLFPNGFNFRLEF